MDNIHGALRDRKVFAVLYVPSMGLALHVVTKRHFYIGL